MQRKRIDILALLATGALFMSCTSVPPIDSFQESAIPAEEGIVHFIPQSATFSDGRIDQNIYIKTDGKNFDAYLTEPKKALFSSGNFVLISSNKFFNQFGSFRFPAGHHTVLVVRNQAYENSDFTGAYKSGEIWTAFTIDLNVAPRSQTYVLFKAIDRRPVLVDPADGRYLIASRRYISKLNATAQPYCIPPK